MTDVLTVSLKERSYPIFFNVPLTDCANVLLPRVSNGKAFVVTDSNVDGLYGETVVRAFRGKGVSVFKIVVPAGEKSKSFACLESVVGALLANGCDRKSFIVALGGGVVGDLAGFAASVVLRGIDFVQIPTTLLACSDSSVGGKTAIDVAAGKNLVGSFYQPRAVLIDTAALSTLPERELRAGYAEVIKYGLIADADFWRELEQEGERVLDPRSEACRRAVFTSCRIKADVVSGDEKETSGARALLNFGHTFGHALESVHAYDGSMLHGEGVALGMLLAAKLSESALGLDPSVCGRMRALYEKTGLSAVLPRDYDAQDLTRRMFSDKKTLNGKLNLVLLKDIGRAVVVKDVSPAAVTAAWQGALRERKEK